MNYFFKSKLEKGKIHVYPLGFQVLDGGDVVDCSKRVTCKDSIKAAYPEGSFFVADVLKLSTKGTHYLALNIRILDLKDKTLRDECEKTCRIKLPDPEKSKKDSIATSILPPKSDADGFYMSPDDWTILVRNIQNHTNTMIIGPTGCGKTSCLKEVCNRLGLELNIFDMGSILDPISSLLGVHRLEDGHSIFDYAKFTQVIQKPGVILLDELSRAAFSTMNILFPCLDDRRSLSIEIAGGKDIREIKIHPEVTFVATANVGAEYTGTNSMDRALVNRFFPIELGNIPAPEEEKVLIKRCGIDPKSAGLLVKVTNNIRSLASKQEISTSLSIRETLMVASLVADGWELSKAMEIVYLPLYEGTKTEGERSTIYKTLSSY